MLDTPSPYIKQALKGFSAYIPGEQPAVDSNLIKLNTNENPFPPSPAVMETLKGFSEDKLRLYPDPLHTRLRQAAGNLLGVSPELVIGGNGSDEILAMILRAFLDPGDVVAYPCPTYSLYPTLALMLGGQISEHPAGLGESKIEAVMDAPAKITFIASPNSPDGYLVRHEDILRLCQKRRGTGIVVADEAYVDFSEGGAIGLVEQVDNLIITRTLSKSFSLAGLRVGIGIACPPLIQALWAVKDSYNLGSLPQALAAAALEDAETMQKNARQINRIREATSQSLRQRGWRVYPSQANFIFTEPPARPAEEIYKHLVSRKIFVRYFPAAPLDRGLRISIGTEAQMQRLLEEIDRM